jgi:hypothetical protein
MNTETDAEIADRCYGPEMPKSTTLAHMRAIIAFLQAGSSNNPDDFVLTGLSALIADGLVKITEAHMSAGLRRSVYLTESGWKVDTSLRSPMAHAPSAHHP